MIRLARADDLPYLQEVERAAGQAFSNLKMSAVAQDDPPSMEFLQSFQADARAWVATDKADRPVAYLLVGVVDVAAHVEQVSVHPSHCGQRLGSGLLDTAAGWAAQRGLGSITLTTFTDVPWNAPYYARLGFRILGEHELAEGLRSIRRHEAALGLDRWPRVAITRGVPAPEAGRDLAPTFP